ncbi:hypothetical protein J2T02_003779 [Chitinophaga terrae (ex Kim and Jung 2007)]|uniref:family 43 glycosylhydrolase n=1 Tax=Chitinophaga terrae (ex Kim and Jung 2007) TaxID=408074 RepID=UPI00278915FE|nr:family 43 glycosylhydrolase [Chitinophaga terrae (ex Kim and Jung 2007)]MDQ0108640.1 hypothetical protein [Chitinophaga terrae (ex Kim and Jung 2007)]
MKYLYLLFFLHLFPVAASAENIYYVDAITGNDENSGLSSGAAWRTVDRVNRQVLKPGDRVRFRAGRIFEGQLKPQGSGSAANSVFIEPYGEGPKPRLQGNGQEKATLHLANFPYITVQDLDISNYGANRMAGRTGVLVESKNYGTVNNTVLRRLVIHDVNGSLVKKEGGGAGITCNNGGDGIPSNFNGLLIDSCSILRCERNGILINGNWSRERWFPNKGVVIRANLIEGVPGDGIVPIGCDSALIEYNVMRDCPRLLPDGEAAAGIWPWSCDNTLVQYNEVSDHKAPWDGQGFDSDWNCNNTVIQYNYSHDNEGGFLLVCNDGSAPRPRNIGNNGTIVRYNVSINDGFRTTGKHSGFSPVFHIAGPVLNTQIYNNVIVMPASRGIDSTIIEMGNWGGYADSSLFANNIFYTATVADYELAKSKRNIFLNNLYAGTHLQRPADKNAVLGDPMFLQVPAPGSDGFAALQSLRLKAGSPAIGKGLALAAPGNDFFRQPLNNGTLNIGIDGQAGNQLPTGGIWYDTAGDTINAHGGSLLFEKGKYYWLGEKRDKKNSQGVSVYSSEDLITWKNEGVAFSPSADPSSEIAEGCLMERPKVLYNPKTRKYIMWFHLELKGQGYKAARAGVAVSDRITGPYKYLGSFRPNGNMSRDLTLFRDHDGKAYLVYASNENYDLRIVRLSADYLRPTAADSLLFAKHREAPAMFRKNNTYYLITSGCTGWDPNAASLHTASSPYGPWKAVGNPMLGDGAALTFKGQPAFVFAVPGKQDAFVYVGDQWNPHNLKDSRYHWLPVVWRDDLPTIPWRTDWTPVFFNNK